MLHVTINGKPYECPEGTILQALRHVNIRIPTPCFDSRTKPYGGCRCCLVEVAGSPRPVASCSTPLVEGAVIETQTPGLENERRTLLGMLARGLPPDTLKKSPGHEFQQYLKEYGLAPALKGKHQADLLDDTHPYIRVDMSQCISCFRCVRICNELQGQFVWQVWNRGEATRIRPNSGTTLLESSCVSCGACADACPTGALLDQSTFKFGEPDQTTRTTCAYCGVGCELYVGTKQGKIIHIAPVAGSPVSKGHLCVKGRYAYGYVTAADRVTDPMIRGPKGWEKVSWEAAILAVAGGFTRVRERHGPGAVGVLGSARATNEDNYLAQKFARLVLGTHNVDNCARVCHAPSAAGLKQAVGTGAATNSYDDIELASTFLVFGSNTTESHPIVGARIRQQALRGANLIVVDPRRTELAELATVHLRPRLGTNLPLLNALAHVIVSESLHDPAFVASRVSGWAAFAEFIKPFTPEYAGALCGIEPELIRRAARLYATATPSMSVHGLGLTEHVQGTEGVLALVNLALLTGNIGKRGAGVNPLRGQNNVQGAAHMGCDPAHLAGYAPVEKGRDLFEGIWKAKLPTAKGLNMMEMMDAADAGTFKALWAIGYDIYLTNPNANQTRESLHALDFLVVQDMFLNETAREAAHVFLPAASVFEKDGTFMNGERRVQRVRQALAPSGQSRPDWAILCGVARAMGHGDSFAYETPEAIWSEIRSVWPAGAGISYARLEQGGIQWPCPSEDHPGTQILHAESFAGGKTAELRMIPFVPSQEAVTPEFPFLLTTGRGLFQFNAGTMTLRTPNRILRPTDVLDISPDDAARLELKAGDLVRVRSRHGEAEITVQPNPALRPGELFSTFTMADVFINHVMGTGRDRVTSTPEYKLTAVQISRA